MLMSDTHRESYPNRTSDTAGDGSSGGDGDGDGDDVCEHGLTKNLRGAQDINVTGATQCSSLWNTAPLARSIGV